MQVVLSADRVYPSVHLHFPMSVSHVAFVSIAVQSETVAAVQAIVFIPAKTKIIPITITYKSTSGYIRNKINFN